MTITTFRAPLRPLFLLAASVALLAAAENAGANGGSPVIPPSADSNKPKVAPLTPEQQRAARTQLDAIPPRETTAITPQVPGDHGKFPDDISSGTIISGGSGIGSGPSTSADTGAVGGTEAPVDSGTGLQGGSTGAAAPVTTPSVPKPGANGDASVTTPTVLKPGTNGTVTGTTPSPTTQGATGTTVSGTSTVQTPTTTAQPTSGVSPVKPTNGKPTTSTPAPSTPTSGNPTTGSAAPSGESPSSSSNSTTGSKSR